MRAHILLAVAVAAAASHGISGCSGLDILRLSTADVCMSSGNTTRGILLADTGPAGPYIVAVQPARVGAAWAALDSALAGSGNVASFLPPAAFLLHVSPAAAEPVLRRLWAVEGVRFVREFAPLLRTDLLDDRVYIAADSWLEPLAGGAPVRAVEVFLANQSGAAAAALLTRLTEGPSAALCASCGAATLSEGASVHITSLARCDAGCALDSPVSCGCMLPPALVAALAADPAVIWVGVREATYTTNGFARGITQTADIVNWWNAGAELGPCGDGSPEGACGLAADVPASLLPLMYPQAGADAPPPAAAHAAAAITRRRASASGDCDPACATSACGQGYTTCTGDYAAGHSALNQAGITGAGQLINVGDSGLDYGSPYFLDVNADVTPTQKLPLVATAHRKVAAYYSFIDAIDGAAGHGTHTSGTVGGDPSSNTSAVDLTILLPSRGIAPDARLVLMDLGCNTRTGCTPPAGIPTNGCGATCPFAATSIFAPADWNNLFGPPYDAGARVSSHSWGGTAASPVYSATAAGIDAALVKRPDLLVIFSAGNAGANNKLGSVSPQSVAKNVLAIGAMRDGLEGHLSKVMGRPAGAGGPALPPQYKLGDARSCTTVTLVAGAVGMLPGGTCPAVIDAAACYQLSENWLTYQKGGYSAADAYQANIDLAFCCNCTAQQVADGWAAVSGKKTERSSSARRELWRPSASTALLAAAAAARDGTSVTTTGMPGALPGVGGVPYAALPQHPYNASAAAEVQIVAAPRQQARLGQDPILADFLSSHEAVYNARTRTYFSSMGPAADGRIKPDISAPGQDTISARARGATALPYGTFKCPATLHAVSNEVAPHAPLVLTGAGTTLFDVALSTSEALLLLNVTLPLVAADAGSLTMYLPSSTDSGPGGGPFLANVQNAPGGGFEAVWDLGAGYQLGPGWAGAIRVAVPTGMQLTVTAPQSGTNPPAYTACFGTMGVNVELNLTFSRGGASGYTHDMSGTSMAAPTVAGLAALMRQYFTDGFYFAGKSNPAVGFSPSGALMRATLINSASELVDADAWAFFQPEGTTAPTRATLLARGGHGIANLGRGLPIGGGAFSETMLLPGRAPAPGTGTDPTLADGDESTFCFDVVASADAPPYDPKAPSLPLLATLAWTDPAGSPAAAYALVNDLDLLLTPPPGTTPVPTLLGNNVWNAATQPRDTLNNAEKISLPAPPPTVVGADRVAAPYVVTVKGVIVPSGPQAYALILTGPNLVSVACPASTA